MVTTAASKFPPNIISVEKQPRARVKKLRRGLLLYIYYVHCTHKHIYLCEYCVCSVAIRVGLTYTNQTVIYYTYNIYIHIHRLCIFRSSNLPALICFRVFFFFFFKFKIISFKRENTVVCL